MSGDIPEWATDEALAWALEESVISAFMEFLDDLIEVQLAQKTCQ